MEVEFFKMKLEFNDIENGNKKECTWVNEQCYVFTFKLSEWPLQLYLPWTHVEQKLTGFDEPKHFELKNIIFLLSGIGFIYVHFEILIYLNFHTGIHFCIIFNHLCPLKTPPRSLSKVQSYEIFLWENCY